MTLDRGPQSVNLDDRIRVRECGCHYDVRTGLTTHYCGVRHDNDYDIWWCPKHGEWTVPSRPHRPECPTCHTPGWWRRFKTGTPYEVVSERGDPI